jgi:hypothetical protein
MRTLLRAIGSADPALIAETCKEIQGLLDSDPTKLRRVRKALTGNGTAIQDEHWSVWRKAIHSEWAEISRQLLNEFPEEHLILPTVLGNLIRSFEYYPDREYGIDTVTLWPRLIAKIDKDYAASIDDAKTGFDFMITCSALSAMLALMVLLIGLATGAPLASLSQFIPWILQIVVLVFIWYLTYLGAINRAPAWGTRVKSAFDLYRNDLLIQLGFNDKPRTKRAERDLWDGISQQLIYGDLPSGPNIDYVLQPSVPTPATNTISIPPGIKIELTRGIKQLSQENSFQILLSVKNVDAAQTESEQVVVTDTLPSDWAYQWGSAEVSSQISNHFKGLVVTGSNPYLFQVGELKFNEEKIVRYRAYWRRPLYTGADTMYRELATRIVLASVQGAGMVTVSGADLHRELSALGFETPERVAELAAFCSSPDVLELHLEPIVRQLMAGAPNVKPVEEGVREALGGIRQQLHHGLHFSSNTSLIDVRDRIATILADSLPGDPSKLPRI